MRGILFDDHIVNLDEATREYGGSWIPGQAGDTIVSYGQDVLKLFHDQLRGHPAPLMLDVGANTGNFCLLAAFYPAMRAYAFEPVEATHCLLRANIAANGLEGRVVPVQLALADYVGQGDMTIPENTFKAGLSYLDNRDPAMPSRRETVPVSTLDAWAADHQIAPITHIKMDVEGTEIRVLRGGEQTIRRDMPIILLEALNTHQTIPLLEQWGYTCTDYKTDILAKRSQS